MKPTRPAIILLLTVVALSVAVGRAAADPLWKKMLPGRAVDADPDADYVLTDRSGPWMIMAATFSGEGAEEQSRELVFELRKRYKLEAYTHRMSFDFSKGTTGRGIDRRGQPVRMRYQRNDKIDEIAVLVGNYPRVDDSEAQKTLKRIKRFRPKALDSQRGTTSQSLAALRTIQAALLSDDDEDKKKGPMGRAFMSRNPKLPRDQFVPPGLDDLVVKMNKGVKHSLLDCEGKYTVKVATFTGTIVIDQQKIRQFKSGKRMPSRLAQAAEKAHRLTLALRQKGYDAYEFHDRHASIVTVGSFNSVGLPRSDGKIEINPQVHEVIKTFGSTPQGGSDAPSPTGFQPRSLAGIAFDMQPQIVHVPRQSIGSAYARR